MVLNTDKRNYSVFISLGSNMGKRMENLKEALKLLESQVGDILLKSSVYKTEGWGSNQLDWFFNMVVKMGTIKSPNELLKSCLEIENAVGRTREGIDEYQNRVIDVDILLIDNLIINQNNLIIPHPRMNLRNFVLVPLAEIAPSTTHPERNKSILELKNNCQDQNFIERME